MGCTAAFVLVHVPLPPARASVYGLSVCVVCCVCACVGVRGRGEGW